MAVQELDTDIDREHFRRAHLEARQMLADLDARTTVVGADRARLQAALDEVTVRQEALEAELAASEKRGADVGRRLYSGEVTASRELQAMSADVESLTRRSSDLEDRILEVLDEREPLDQGLEAIDGELADASARRVVLVDEVAAGEAAVDAALAELTARRAEQVATVTPDLVATYEGLRARLGGVGAARLVGNQCTGCHLTLPSMELDRIRHLPPDTLVTCEDCGRILIRKGA